jgi:glycosyltransferase involved in cell wall biosynthesis
MPAINTALTLKDLPSALPGKTGWPWTEQSDPLPERMLDGAEWPRISVITPSYNQGQFIEETIRSVLLQGYPNFEYIIIDGGSTDNSIEIIKKYENYLTYWVSEPDQGQSHAINKGFARATGQILNWLNSDDWFDKNAFSLVANKLGGPSDVEVIYGDCFLTNSQGKEHRIYTTHEFSVSDLILRNFIGQPTVFFRKELWEKYGGINESLVFALDYELWLRWALENVSFKYIPEIKAYYRLHENSKSCNLIRTNQNESIAILVNLERLGKFPLELKPKLHHYLYSLCLWNYARLDFHQFWYVLIYYLKVSRKAPDWELLKRALSAILGESIISFFRETKRRILVDYINSKA